MIDSRPACRLAWLALLVISVAVAIRVPTTAQELPSRQVVMFGVVATPDSTVMDPKISPVVAARLRRALPNHGFKLIKIKSDRVIQGGSLTLDLGNGFVSSAHLLNPTDPNGKVQMRFELTLQGLSQFQSIVATPADQFNFFDKMLPDNSRLLIGVGAR
jgi:hypothetical protein